MQAVAKVLNASPAGHYLNWSVIHISLTNALIIVAMIVLFGLALILPFPSNPDDRPEPSGRRTP